MLNIGDYEAAENQIRSQGPFRMAVNRMGVGDEIKAAMAPLPESAKVKGVFLSPKPTILASYADGTYTLQATAKLSVTLVEGNRSVPLDITEQGSGTSLQAAETALVNNIAAQALTEAVTPPPSAH